MLLRSIRQSLWQLTNCRSIASRCGSSKGKPKFDLKSEEVLAARPESIAKDDADGTSAPSLSLLTENDRFSMKELEEVLAEGHPLGMLKEFEESCRNTDFEKPVTDHSFRPIDAREVATGSNSESTRVIETPKVSCSYYSAPVNCDQEDEQDYRYRQNDHEPKEKAEPCIGSPARIQKLIASQTDPLLAKEIFDLASRQPNFRHSYATYHTLILKLGCSRHFSLMNTVISSLKSLDYSISPSLFTHIIQIYGDANQPEKALKIFYRILEFNMKPRQKHLNSILEILVANTNFLRPAFDLFRAAHRYGVSPNTNSYNIMMRAFCLNGDLSIAYTLFNLMFKRDVLPDVESYRILMQALCRKSQVNKAADLLEDMLNKGFVPDTLSHTTLLNALCRKKKLKEAYKLLCRMKVKGCNPDIVHYNTVISGYCKAGCAADACKVLEDMSSNGCSPNLLSYQNIVGGLCSQGMYDEARGYLEVMMTKEFRPHFSVVHMLVKGLCKLGKIEDACGVVVELLRHGSSPHAETWAEIVGRMCEVDDVGEALKEAAKVEIKSDSRIVDVGAGLEEYLMRKIKTRSKNL